MTHEQAHILNGDALRHQFLTDLEGVRIVARECLIDGDVSGDSLEDIYNTRACFLDAHYGVPQSEYFAKSQSEFQKIKSIPANTDINLWFEDDLFCQVNFWFVSFLLVTFDLKNDVYLVRPPRLTLYGFGALDTSELKTIYSQRTQIRHIAEISKLWLDYQSGDFVSLEDRANALSDHYPFFLPAVKAHMERNPSETWPEGKPISTLRSIMKELNTIDFKIVFREFSRRLPIYGFGDLQVKRLYDVIVDS